MELERSDLGRRIHQSDARQEIAASIWADKDNSKFVSQLNRGIGLSISGVLAQGEDGFALVDNANEPPEVAKCPMLQGYISNIPEVLRRRYNFKMEADGMTESVSIDLKR